jgi:hypothetical protein
LKDIERCIAIQWLSLHLSLFGVNTKFGPSKKVLRVEVPWLWPLIICDCVAENEKRQLDLPKK